MSLNEFYKLLYGERGTGLVKRCKQGVSGATIFIIIRYTVIIDNESRKTSVLIFVSLHSHNNMFTKKNRIFKNHLYILFGHVGR